MVQTGERFLSKKVLLDSTGLKDQIQEFRFFLCKRITGLCKQFLCLNSEFITRLKLKSIQTLVPPFHNL